MSFARLSSPDAIGTEIPEALSAAQPVGEAGRAEDAASS